VFSVFAIVHFLHWNCTIPMRRSMLQHKESHCLDNAP
jgi:hypothetical protein